MINLMLREYLQVHSMDKNDLAGSAGVSIDKMEQILDSGKRLSAEEYFMICQALHVDLNYFFEKWKERGRK